MKRSITRRMYSLTGAGRVFAVLIFLLAVDFFFATLLMIIIGNLRIEWSSHIPVMNFGTALWATILTTFGFLVAVISLMVLKEL